MAEVEDIVGKSLMRLLPSTDVLETVGADVVAAIDIPMLREGIEPGGFLLRARKAK